MTAGDAAAEAVEAAEADAVAFYSNSVAASTSEQTMSHGTGKSAETGSNGTKHLPCKLAMLLMRVALTLLHLLYTIGMVNLLDCANADT